MAWLVSELWWAALVLACAQAVRMGISLWIVMPAAYLVDFRLVASVEPDRPLWLWFLNALAMAAALQAATSVAAVAAMEEVPDDPQPAPPTGAQRAMAEVLAPHGFTPVADHAVLVGDPPMHLWVLLRDDGTLAELVHREPHPAGFGFRTQLAPPAPDHDTVESVPWVRGCPASTTRRISLRGATCDELLAAHDAALVEARDAGARPRPLRPGDALANVLASDREAASRVLARPWRSMLRAPFGLRAGTRRPGRT